jgi:hypothetical protein
VPSTAALFVAALGASSYTFARATLNQDLSHWIGCHVLAFEFFQGTSKLIVPDNPRTGVTRACRYEPDLIAPTQPLEREPDSGSDRAPESAVVRKNSVSGHKTGHSHLNELCQGMA